MAESRGIDINVLRQLMTYDPETGKLTWLHRPVEMFSIARTCKTWNTRYAGTEALSVDNGKGYLGGYILGRMHKAHRVIWLMHHGVWPSAQIDHINGVRSDNRICNLRAVTNQENAQNQKIRSTNKSGVMGVYWFKAGRKWHAHIRKDGKQTHLGFFIDLEDAVAARKAAEVELGYHINHGRLAV